MTPLDVSWNPYEENQIEKEAKDIYTSILIAILEPLKDAYRQNKRGNPNQLLEPEFINQILIKEDDFINLYINEFRPK